MKHKTYKSRRHSIKLLICLIFAALFFNSAFMAEISSLGTSHLNNSMTSVQETEPNLQKLREKLSQFAETIRFQYDSTVLPPESIRALDSIIQLINEQDEGYQYLFYVHSYEPGQTAAYALQYSKTHADAICKYLINQGIASQSLVAQGKGSNERRCFKDDEPNCYYQNNRVEIVIHRKIASEEQQTTLSRLMDRTHTEYRQVLADILKEYFVGGENTLHLQVNVNPCHITVIETYSYYGNPHIRLWTFSTEHLSGFTMVSQSEMQIMISDGGGMMYDSRSKGLDKLQYITLAGISGDARDVRDQWERAWYYYKQACNEPPRAY